MEKASVCLCVLLCFSASSFSSLAYEDFESYVVGAEDTGGIGDLWLNWAPAMSGGHPAPNNPFLTPYVDDTVSYGGGKSVRLDAPLLVWDDGTSSIVPSTAGWGVIIRDDGATVDVSAYNVLTAMIKSGGISTCRIIVRDSAGQEVGNDVISVPNDGDWHKITVILDGAGSKSIVQRILPFFSGIAADATGPQMWLDEIQFELVKLAPDLLDVQGAGGPVGGTTLYSFTMTEQPSDVVTFTLTPPAQLDLGAGFGEPIALNFSGADWDIPQEVEIAIDPAAGAGMVLIGVSVSSVLPEYDQAVDGTFSFPILGPYGAFYVISPDTPVWGSPSTYSGDSGIDLANGVIANNFWLPLSVDLADLVEWAPNAYSPAKPPYAEITFDFGYIRDIDSIDIYYAAGNFPPGSFDVSYSDDDITYTAAESTPAFIGGIISKTRITNDPAVSARYVKLIARCVNDDPGKWFFLSEVEFNVPLPERIPPYYVIDASNIPMGRNQDPFEEKLLNGVISYASASPDWVFFEQSDQVTPYDTVILWINYGQKREFSNLTLNYFSGWGVNPPAAVKLSFSDDGLVYGPQTVLTGWYLGAGGGCTDAKSFAPQQGQYVKVELVRGEGAHCLRMGEIILANRKEVSYAIDPTTPVWGGSTAASGDVAVEAGLQRIKMGDLTNHRVASVVGTGNDPDWVEWAPNAAGTPPYALITFNLGAPVNVKNVAITYCSFPNSGATVPGGLEAAFSTDGVSFSALTDVGAVFEDNTLEAEVFTTIFDLPDTQTQYVTLKIHCKDNNPANWFFISEVKFNTFMADITDDGTVGTSDLGMMIEQWLQTGDNLTADIAGDDAAVDLLDFAVLGMEWLE